MIVRIDIPEDTSVRLAELHGAVTGMAESIEKNLGKELAKPVRNNVRFLQKLMDAVDDAKPVTE